MYFEFPPAIKKGIAEGIYKVMVGNDGVAQSTAVLADGSNKIVGKAIAVLDTNGNLFNPVVANSQLAMNVTQMGHGVQAVQVGLKSIEANLGVLQTMTALTGAGVAANLGISAVSLWHILKLREDIKMQRLEIREGFLDLKQMLKEQGAELIQAIGEAVEEIEFLQQRQALAQAYGRFLEATKLMKLAMVCEDGGIRNADLANARQILTEALADYKNPHFLSESDAVTKLRRLECTWAIEQTIAITYQLQNQSDALSHCLGELQTRIGHDILTVTELCSTEDELDLIFPEVTRICEQDLAILKLWQEQTDWMRSLSPNEQKLLQSVASDPPEPFDTLTPTSEIAVPPEQLLYETLKPKSHIAALCNVLQLMVQPKMRQEYEKYVEQQAKKAEKKAFTLTNLQQMSDLALANLYWYFYLRDE